MSVDLSARHRGQGPRHLTYGVGLARRVRRGPCGRSPQRQETLGVVGESVAARRPWAAPFAPHPPAGGQVPGGRGYPVIARRAPRAAA